MTAHMTKKNSKESHNIQGGNFKSAELYKLKKCMK